MFSPDSHPGQEQAASNWPTPNFLLRAVFSSHLPFVFIFKMLLALESSCTMHAYIKVSQDKAIKIFFGLLVTASLFGQEPLQQGPLCF